MQAPLGTSTGPWVVDHCTTVAATCMQMVVGVVLGPACRGAGAAQPAAGCTCTPEHLPWRRCWRTATPAPPHCHLLGIRAGWTGAAPPPACDHDEQRPHRTAAHGAARAPPRPPGARLGQGTSHNEPHGGHDVGRRVGVVPLPTPGVGAPSRHPCCPHTTTGPAGHCAATSQHRRRTSHRP